MRKDNRPVRVWNAVFPPGTGGLCRAAEPVPQQRLHRYMRGPGGDEPGKTLLSADLTALSAGADMATLARRTLVASPTTRGQT